MKDLAYYRRLPYTFRAEPVTEDDGAFYWLARCEQIPEVHGSGDTEAEAYRWARLCFDDYVQAMLKWKDKIPEPQPWRASLVNGDTMPIGGEGGYKGPPLAYPTTPRVAKRRWTVARRAWRAFVEGLPERTARAVAEGAAFGFGVWVVLVLLDWFGWL